MYFVTSYSNGASRNGAHERRLAHMFKSQKEDELYIEREDDFANTESNAYLACIYAQLSVSGSPSENAYVPMHEQKF